ncbi:hypothetical protein UY3_13773 [Chelonia mydas]|uniref:Uncharacterized protein n=1 Tax=Chelonia mydas TaxID=8469 RepID=M7BAD3_CHEMY|nr:hypothetical protein UY3_13773 [Chelonia mydas]
MGAVGSGAGRGTYWPPLAAAPIGLEQRIATTGSHDRPNLRTQQLRDLNRTETARRPWLEDRAPVPVN